MKIIKNDDGKTCFLGNINYVKDCEKYLQPNQISQGLYRCSPMAKKILSYVIADLNIVKWSNSSVETYEAIFKTSEFAKALGLKNISSKTREDIKKALIELQKSYIAIDTGERFDTFSWVTHSVYAEKEHIIAVEINHHLGQALIEFKKGYTAIQLLELGKLQSFYAMRFYELALSFSGFSGTKGNKKNSWYFDYSVDNIRQLFQIKNDEYSGRMDNFISKVIENPLEEINQKTNLNISFEKIKEGKNIVGIRFYCSLKLETIKISKSDTKQIRDEKIRRNEEQEKIAKLRELHSDRWQEIYDYEMSLPFLLGSKETQKIFAKNKADTTLMQELNNEL